MAKLHRLIFALLLAAFAVPALAANETIPATSTTRTARPMYEKESKWYDSLNDACAGRFTPPMYTSSVEAFPPGEYSRCYAAGTGTPYAGYYVSVYTMNACYTNGTAGPSCLAYTCPVDAGNPWTLSGATCTRPIAKCKWTLGDNLGKTLTYGDVLINKGSTLVCYYGCQWTVNATQEFWWKNDAGVYVGYANAGQMTGNGAECTGVEGGSGGGGPASDAPPATPEPFPKPPCQPGYIPGTITANGVTTTLCQPAIDTQTVKEKAVSESTPEGPKSTTTNETTVCNVAGSCTTTTTTSVSINNGTPTTTTTTQTQGKESYCAASPGKKECGTGSGSWSGDCIAGFKGEGDPVTVAMAREIHIQNCKLNAVTAESALYDAAKVKTGDQTTNLPGNETKAITSADIDQTNAIVGGTCIADRTININLVVTTSTLVLPFSSICPLLDYFRLVLIALGFFIAYRIIGGR